jgi:MoaA/NifB/PqqE/SkfB family radical SAM enzyme
MNEIPSPLAAMIDVSRKCNSHCSYCSDWSKKNQAELKLDTIYSLIDELQEIGTKYVCFSGGEPLLYKNIAEAIQYTKQKNISAWLITNGLLLTKHRLDQLVKNGLECCILSIDSIDPTCYQQHRGVPFQHIESALDSLQISRKKSKKNLHIILNCVVTRINQNKLFELVDYANQQGFYILLQPYESRVMSLPIEEDPFQFRDEDFILLEETLSNLLSVLDYSPILNSPFFLKHMTSYLRNRSMPEGFQCNAAEIAVCIGNNGEWYPCWHLPSVGNIHHNTLQSIMRSEEAEAARAKMKTLNCPTCWTSCHLEFVHVIEKLTGNCNG